MATAALTNTPTSIADGESITGWSGDTFSLEPDIKVEGSNSVACAQTVSGNNDATFTKATGSWDFSGGEHLRIWWNSSAVPAYADTEAAGGVQIGLSDGSNTDYFYISGSDTYGGGWKLSILYTLTTPDVDNSANLAAITSVAWRMATTAKPRNVPANLWLDAWSFGDGFTVTGGTSGDELDWSHIASVDATNAYGVVSEVDGVYFLAGEITIGDGISTTYFSPSSQIAVFKDLPVSSTLYQIIFFDDASALTNIDILSGTWSAAGTQRFLLDASETTINSFSIDGLQMSRGDDGNSFHAGASITNTVFNDCLQVIPSTATFTNNTFANSVATDGAMLWPTSGNASQLTFINCDRGVEVTQTTNQSFTDMVFDDAGGNFDVHLNNGGTDIDISKTGTTNANSYTATGGGVVTFVGASVDVQVTSKETDGDAIGSALVMLKASDGTGPFPFEESITIARSGTTATVTHSTHGMATNDYVVIRNAADENFNIVAQITVTGASAYTYTVIDTGATSDTSADATFVALYGTTHATTGILSTSRVYSSDQPVTGWSRKSSGSPFYKEGIINGIVYSASGLAVNAVMGLDE